MSDQALVATTRCRQWPCNTKDNYKGAPLVPRKSPTGRDFWTYCCSNCGASYGVQPDPSLRDLSVRPANRGEIWPWMTKEEEAEMVKAQRKSWTRQDKD